MGKIIGVEKVEQALGKWAPSDLAVIEALEILIEDGSAHSNLVIVALFQSRTDSWPSFDKEMFRVVISFSNVANLNLKGFGGGAVQIMGFDIHDVGDRGLEGINYEIEDYEDNRICFNCECIHIQSILLVPPESWGQIQS